MIAPSVLLFALLSVVSADNYATYPQVPQTASINGFADPIYAELPTCAQSCVKFSTSNTPCPYWDTGCLCVMAQWNDEVASCIAENCSGGDVSSATELANSLCSSVGANTWMLYSSDTAILSAAAAKTADSTATETSSSSAATSDSSSDASSSASSASSASSEDSSSQVPTTITSAISSSTSSASSSTDSDSTESSNVAVATANSANALVSAGLFAAALLFVPTLF